MNRFFRQLWSICCLACCLVATWVTFATGEEFILADGRAWPGKIVVATEQAESVFATRPDRLPTDLTPRVQSLTKLNDGRIIFCSGLDRSLIELLPRGERVFKHGGYLARQVRTDRDGTLYWSGLETPLNSNPLPDGFIYKLDASGNTQTVMTFSQGDVGRDWWGAFDVVDGRIFVGTISGRTTIYDVSVSPVQRVCTLPISATAFRFRADGSIYACDGRGTLHRYADRNNPERSEVVLRSTTPFVDFDFSR
ncbi:hypothetical protein ETAA8_59730 [Anatilimnocola aggregata]|uniref:Uncharacterized protein n=1 Tax=Anatilimnocola aggregata TaxID=2528021 RepID=A0A517YKT7_9BACT|nr:hypothetical protein [Anatilimnocola aggregata]QDU30824.1 hypothetical protein ETAA8_59730 [Anatilimnocola aggregata]